MKIIDEDDDDDMPTGQFQIAAEKLIAHPIQQTSLVPAESPLEDPDVKQLSTLKNEAAQKATNILLLLREHNYDPEDE